MRSAAVLIRDGGKMTAPAELADRETRPSCGAPDGGAVQGAIAAMESIRPVNSDPIPLRPAPHRMGTIMIRFVGLLVLAIAALALIYSR